jgi:hypothetical protein
MLVLGTPESLKLMKLLEETVLVNDHGVDGLVDDGLVVEHVVVVLVDDHEVVAEGHKVVAEVEEKSAKIVFHFVMARRVCLLALVDVADRQGLEVSELWSLVVVNAGRYAPLAPDL